MSIFLELYMIVFQATYKIIVGLEIVFYTEFFSVFLNRKLLVSVRFTISSITRHTVVDDKSTFRSNVVSRRPAFYLFPCEMRC
jgi:hypothetical protein